MLKVTNEYRANHDANPLEWNNTLADYSREWAEACIWKHSVCIKIPTSTNNNANITTEK